MFDALLPLSSRLHAPCRHAPLCCSFGSRKPIRSSAARPRTAAPQFTEEERTAPPDAARGPQADLHWRWTNGPRWMRGRNFEGETFFGSIARGRHFIGSTVGIGGDVSIEIAFSTDETSTLPPERSSPPTCSAGCSCSGWRPPQWRRSLTFSPLRLHPGGRLPEPLHRYGHGPIFALRRHACAHHPHRRPRPLSGRPRR
jgi:hypothetical protein